MSVVQLLLVTACLSSTLVFHGANADSAPTLATQANFPHVVLVIDESSQNRHTSVVLSKKFILSHSDFTSTNTLSTVSIYLGDTTTATAVKPISIYNNGNVAVLKICSKANPINQFYDLTPSAFYSFSTANAPAKHIFYKTNKVLYYVNTTVLSDDNCPADRALYGNYGNSYNTTTVACTKGDTTASCEWYWPLSGPRSFSLLMVQSQAVAILIEGDCPNTLLWASTVFHTKILPHRPFIMQTIA